MTATLGAAACVLGMLCAVGFGFNIRAWSAGLQTAYNPVIVCAGYLGGMLAGLAGACLALGVV